jgi:hypothetical protein
MFRSGLSDIRINCNRINESLLYSTIQCDLKGPEKATNSDYEIKINFKKWEWRFKSHPKPLPQHLHIAVTAVATVHIGKSTEEIS